MKLVDFCTELEIFQFWSFHKRVQFLVVDMSGFLLFINKQDGLPGKR
jgi:hypothetical protein